MRRNAMLVALAVMMAGPALAAPPATSPVKPSTRQSKEPPKQRVSLMNGAVKFMVPEDWTEAERTEDGKNVTYQSPDGLCKMMIGVNPQQYAVPLHNDALREQLKGSIINGMKKYFQDNGVEVLYGPRSETDDRFYIRIHDTVKEGDEVMDEIHLYRPAGLDVLMVTTAVRKEKKDEAKPYHTVGEDTCLSMVLGPADKKPAKK
jgi:hypothetical protein